MAGLTAAERGLSTLVLDRNPGVGGKYCYTSMGAAALTNTGMSLDRFHGDATFSTWITRIAINNALMHQRRIRPEEEYDTVIESDNSSVLPFPGSLPEGAEAQLGRLQLRRILEELVNGLPPDLRLVFILSEAEGMTNNEIARDLELNPVTVKTRLFRARRWLRTDLERRVKGGFDAIFPFDGARCANMAERVVQELGKQGYF